MSRDIRDALGKNRKAWQNFEQVAPGQRRRYLVWPEEVRKHEMSRKRIGEAAELIANDVRNLLE